MNLLLDTFPALAPLAMMAVALVARRQPGVRPRAVLAMATLASVVSLAVAVGTAVRVAVLGSVTSPLLGWNGLGFSLRQDALSAVMLGLVAFMGAVVLRYSRNYLDGDPGHGRFLGGIALTVGCVMFLVLAGNLVHLSVFWAATSFALHRLLLFYPERRGARVAARKKFLVARAGDVALAVAAVLLYGAFGTADLATLLASASTVAAGPGMGGSEPAGLAAGVATTSVHAAALLVALSAALKSAQFPTHGWLAEVMETPTPVSALLHAGIINGGTFLVVRLADVMILSSGTLHLLLVVGGFTALFGSVVLVTQNSVKVALAYSSSAHMGFMLLLCGLGAFTVAILHLVAHSFYKAHAFLSSGSAVEAATNAGPAPETAPPAPAILLGMLAAVATVAGVAALLGMRPQEDPVTLGLSAVLAIALTQLWGRGLMEGRSGLVLGRTALAAAATTVAFFTLEAGAAAILGPMLPALHEAGTATLGLMSGVVVLFAAAVLAQLRLPALRGRPGWRALYVHLRNGLYANAFFDRVVGALRVPRQPARSA